MRLDWAGHGLDELAVFCCRAYVGWGTFSFGIATHVLDYGLCQFFGGFGLVALANLTE